MKIDPAHDCFLRTFAAMFKKLRKKWKVSGLQLALILCTFAIGGSITGYAARKLMPVLDIDNKAAWIIIYIVLVTLIWPLAVLVISIPFGQFRFFANYLRKIGRRMGIGKQIPADSPVSIAIFASGNGSNAAKIMEYFADIRQKTAVSVDLIVTNNEKAGVVTLAQQRGIPVLVVDKNSFPDGATYAAELKKRGIGFIVLAGFLWKIPPALLQAFPRAVINIHPALLPKYGGQGMYGRHVHEAVLAAGEKETGITIHFADEWYDHGTVIFQARCPVLENDTAESLAARVLELEHQHYPQVIHSLLQS